MDLVVEIYQISKLLPKEELFALSAQMRRSAVSIPSNIAEGQARLSRKEFIQFLSIAKGSNAELQTQCLICVKLNLISEADAAAALSLSSKVGKMLNALLASLTTNN